MSKREIKRFSSVLYFIVSCSILFVNRKHIVRRISLMMEDGMFNRISRGQAAENRKPRASARLKLKEGGEIMKSDEKKDTLYLCDPQKNTECPKGNCQIPDGCFLTIKKEFAVTDKNGKPIIGIELHQEQSSQQ